MRHDLCATRHRCSAHAVDERPLRQLQNRSLFSPCRIHTAIWIKAKTMPGAQPDFGSIARLPSLHTERAETRAICHLSEERRTSTSYLPPAMYFSPLHMCCARISHLTVPESPSVSMMKLV